MKRIKKSSAVLKCIILQLANNKNVVLLLLTCVLLCAACRQPKKLFTELTAAETNISFSNRITENDSINILDNEYIYNGGGVAIADFNNDGQQDIYFSGNMVSNRLYLNKGNTKFEDVTTTAKVSGEGNWCSGVAVVDVNADGLQDIYVCTTLKNNSADRKNILYINQGNNKSGVPLFKEMAAAYGLDDTTHSTNAVFFDFDKDNDLDVFIAVDEIDPLRFPNKYHHKITDGTASSTGRLYRNDMNDSLGHPVFTNVSKQAGITIEGFGLGVHVTDINRDGWQDIYVTNDYISNDLLYINNRNGTFTNKARDYFKHTSFSAMGNDVADINNDGLLDVIALDMLPEDNYRKKMMLNPNNYSSYINTREFDYDYQYVRNTLQLNLGNRPGADSLQHPVFADIAYYANLAGTDWSWTPLVADFDNDGFRDIIITNGFPNDVTDHDFIAYRNNTKNYAPKHMLLTEIPAVKIKNYAFRNNGNLTFTKATEDWGITRPTFSSGAAYGDLDNDGDLDYVVSNINDSASVFINNSNDAAEKANRYLRIKLIGDAANKTALGAFVKIEYADKQQVCEQTIYRGYLSCIEPYLHFGLGTDTIVKKITVTWPDGLAQTLLNVATNQLLVVEKQKNTTASAVTDAAEEKTILNDVTGNTGINFIHTEKDYIDFNIQKLLPHKFSEYGPALATGDVNGDGLDDFFTSGSFGYSGVFFLQDKNGRFIEKVLDNTADFKSKLCDDAGVLLFDADKDNDLDLVIAAGGFESPDGSPNYADRFYKNDGKGNFSKDSLALPFLKGSKSCVKACDYDKDGDLDLFIGGRVIPGKYPAPASSFILRNDSKSDAIKFTDVTDAAAPLLSNFGLVCDMLWTDFDNDGWTDMVLTGEWMPITFLKNNKGLFSNQTAASGIHEFTGWWNSLAAGDFDNDGDIDYIAGNSGLNSFYKASQQYPVSIYAYDYNGDGGYDAIPTIFLPAVDNSYKEFPAFGRDDMIKQMITVKARFTNYKSYATATITDILKPEEIKNSLRLSVNYLSSAHIKNNGNGKFQMQPLPPAAQLSSLFGMLVYDTDGDGNLDILLNGNDYSTEIATGRYDALNGLLLKGDGEGNFLPISAAQSGLYIPGNGKGFIVLKSAAGQPYFIASQNQNNLLAFSPSISSNLIPLNTDDILIEYALNNGQVRREEVYYGSTFYSQSGRYAVVGPGIKSITVTNIKNQKRALTF